MLPSLSRIPKLIASLLLLSVLPLYSIDQSPIAKQRPDELGLEYWFTGPLLTPSANCVPEGHYNLEPYLFYTWIYGSYTADWGKTAISHIRQTVVQPLIQFGLNWGFDITAAPGVIFNNSHGSTSIGFADLPITLGYQIIKENKDTWRPSLRLIIQELCPTGLYERLNPSNNGNDAFGGGVFRTTVGLIIGKLFRYSGQHALNTRGIVSYGVAHSAHVEEFNSYGGGYGTNGKVYPGNIFQLGGAFEYAFTQHWVFALDGLYVHNDKTRFSGKAGKTSTGDPASSKIPSREQISFAPALEYNITRNLGIIAGCWFTVAGRNSAQFVSAAIALNYYH